MDEFEGFLISAVCLLGIAGFFYFVTVVFQ